MEDKVVEYIREYLVRLGIKSAEYANEGTVKTPKAEYEMISKEVKLVSESPRKQSTRGIVETTFFPLFCIFGFEPWCWVRKYMEPDIKFDIHATKARDVHVHLARGYIEGVIDTLFHNMSKEGKTWLENVKTGERREERTVMGSADLLGSFAEKVIIKKLNEALADIENKIDKTKPNIKVTIDSGFEKRGYLDMIKNIFNILIKGKVYVDDDIDVTVSYSWLGETRSRTYKIDITANLPVEDVHWHLL